MKFRSLLSTIFIVNVLFLTNSCSRITPDPAVQENIISEFRTMTVAYYRDAPDGNSIGVRFYETPVIINLPKSQPGFEKIKLLLDESRDQQKPVAIRLNEMNSITDAKVPNPQELDIFNNIWHHQGTDTTDPVFYRNVISMDELNEIFDYMESQGCATGTAEIDHCITFQYVVDGCYARAHKMRQILHEKYKVNCEKVFSFEGDDGYLAVDAGDCCVFWWYHVAPLMTVSTMLGPRKFVMDPSMFDHPVTIEEWTTAQENTTCTPYADFGFYDITPGWAYGPGWAGGGYSHDDNYTSTDWTLIWYEDLVTCD